MTGKTIKDYYAILGISSQASLDEIRQAYRNKARQYHPDLNSGADAEMRFREVNEAYEVLANPQQRRMYDGFTLDEPIPTVPTPEVSPEPPSNVSFAEMDNTVVNPHANVSSKPVRSSPPTWALLLIMIGAFIILGVVAGLLISSSQPKPGGDAVPATFVKISTFLSPPVIQEGLTVIQESGNPVILNSPVSLNVRGQVFDIVPVQPDSGRWPMPAEGQQLGMWMHGTVINYVIGLPWDASTEALFNSIGSGDSIILTLENGSRLTFGSPVVQHIASDDLTPLEQTSPGVTMILLGGDSPSRLLVQARYLPQSTDYKPVYEVDGLKVEVQKSWVIEEISGGAVAFVIEYQLTNETGKAFTVAYFDMALEDATGRRYIPNAVVSRNGENGELTGTVDPGSIRQGSAGYLIAKESLAPITWVFKSDVNAADSVRIIVPFEPPSATPAQPEVEISDMFLDTTRDVIVVSGTVRNLGEMDLIVNQADLQLTTMGSEYPIRVSAPFLPWTIAGGSLQDFELQFALPRDADTAMLDILGFAIEIEGLLP